jgi:hypothetical protein
MVINMKGNRALSLGIVACLTIIIAFVVDMIGNTFFGLYELIDPYLFNMFMLTLGIVLFAVGLIGRLSKGKHRDGYNVVFVVGFITLLAVYLYYWMGWFWF